MPRQLSSRTLAIVAAVCAGVTLTDVYIAQPLVTLMAADLGVSVGAAQGVITSSLVGYAAGLLFLVPLADRYQPRHLVRIFSSIGTAALLLGTMAPNLILTIVATLVAAMFGIIPQILIPLVMSKSAVSSRARAMSIVQTGMICGMMLSRPALGVLGQYSGWRAAYLAAAIATIIVGWTTSFLLPDTERTSSVSYAGLFRSMGRFVRISPQLRNACLRSAAMYAAFNALWATLTPVLTAAPFNLSVGQASLVGILGLGSAFVAPFAGILTDRHGSRLTIGLGLGALVAALACFWAGHSVLWLMLAGVLLLPAGLQYGQVSSQHAALSVDHAAGGRLNTVFMFSSFIGGAIGSQVAGLILPPLGWTGVCAAAAIFLAAAILLSIIGTRKAAPALVV
ncbi:MAG TPA: MFS transporter [Lacisediminihabitans sp.]|uniref:MFS transporter n=1 Tax=Lacisediminihabitans sp. TaxID=2787631 RepID=UPI002ED906E0